MRALVVLLALTGCGLLVTFFWRQQLLGRVEPMPPLVAQLERLVEAGALGGASPERLVATLVFSEPFKEADPWDLAPRRKGGMGAMFGEPRETAFLAALGREPGTAGWRLPAADAAAAAEAQAQMAAALAWASEKGVRLRVIAHGPALDPVPRAALAAAPSQPPVVERLLGVGVRLGDVKARDPELAAALERRAPAGQWFDLFSEASVVPRELGLERLTPGAPPELQELAWPGSSWVPTVVGLCARGAPQSAPAMPSAAPGSQLSVRQFRSVKDGKMTQRIVDGKGNLVSGSLIVPKLDKEEVPPDPEAGVKAAGGAEAVKQGVVVPLGDSGWWFDNGSLFTVKGVECLDKQLPLEQGPRRSFSTGSLHGLFSDSRSGHHLYLDCLESPGGFERVCEKDKGSLLRVSVHGRPALICKNGKDGFGRGLDAFSVPAGPRELVIEYKYPGTGREGQIERFQKAIEALRPPAGK